MGEFGPWHLLIVAGVFVLLFGAKKLPDAARSLGKSARILKTELKGMHDDGDVAKPAELTSSEAVVSSESVTSTESAPKS